MLTKIRKKQNNQFGRAISLVALLYCTLLTSKVDGYDVKYLGEFLVSDSQIGQSFYDLVKAAQKNYSQEKTNQGNPVWTTEYHSMVVKGFHFTCYEIKSGVRKCEIATQYGAGERGRNYKGVSQFENTIGSKHFTYSRKFRVDEKNKDQVALYDWVRKNTKKRVIETLEGIADVHIVRFNEVNIVCWKIINGPLGYCEIDKLND